jgi:hypothetical protein
VKRGSDDGEQPVAASRVWADREHATRAKARRWKIATAGCGNYCLTWPKTAALGLSDALSDAAPRGLAGQPQNESSDHTAKKDYPCADGGAANG